MKDNSNIITILFVFYEVIAGQRLIIHTCIISGPSPRRAVLPAPVSFAFEAPNHQWTTQPAGRAAGVISVYARGTQPGTDGGRWYSGWACRRCAEIHCLPLIGSGATVTWTHTYSLSREWLIPDTPQLRRKGRSKKSIWKNKARGHYTFFSHLKWTP